MKHKESIKKWPRTHFIDLDGCVIEHNGDIGRQVNTPTKLLPGVLEKFIEFDRRGDKIFLTTGRRESMRDQTEKDLKELGLFWDQLIMGCNRGQRILWNDLKPGIKTPTAVAINIKRNEGFENVKLP